MSKSDGTDTRWLAHSTNHTERFLMRDLINELLIRAEMRRMLKAKNDDERRRHWQRMAELIRRRSPRLVRKMEEERGLI